MRLNVRILQNPSNQKKHSLMTRSLDEAATRRSPISSAGAFFSPALGRSRLKIHDDPCAQHGGGVVNIAGGVPYLPQVSERI